MNRFVGATGNDLEADVTEADTRDLDRSIADKPAMTGATGPSAHEEMKMSEEMLRIYAQVQAAQKTLGRLEPGISIHDPMAIQLSIAISLKRLADAFEHKDEV